MKFNEKLVLNRYLLSLFGVNDFEELAEKLKDERLEECDENNISFFYYELTKLSNKKISDDKLLEYDENIARHTKAINRGNTFKWKYFQYLSLLFIEIYLDKYFENKENLLHELNSEVENFNENLDNTLKSRDAKKEKLEKYNKSELHKLALYNATGSGKTLLMHINFLQFNHYSKNKININQTLLITPNEGLSDQHLKEFEESNIEAEIFSKNAGTLFDTSGIKILEITKLGEQDGDKTVAVDSFEDNNLVFIDEGHRGSSGDKWKINRDKLSEKGFAFEYSATFAQAVNSVKTQNKKILENEYCKSIIFDYSYKYFYNDGYGKDYSILNLSKDTEEIKQSYLIGSLLTFYQQIKIYETQKETLKKYLIEKPLMVFVGSSVNAVRSESKKQVSDVVDILLFLDRFITNKSESISIIQKILSVDSGLQTASGGDIFDKKFSFLRSLSTNGANIFEDILQTIFNASNGVLHIENLKGVDGEIALRIGENEAFGVINVGDSDKLVKLCEENGLQIASKDFASSLFHSINNKKSQTNILIGSKKFTEGWSSWRVSTMGLMNVGKSEGSQIIQLFGRGVRLKGYDFCLKRSRDLEEKSLELNKKYQPVETLNIFGLKSDYMKVFRDYLKSEGVPIEEKIDFILPLLYDENYKTKKLQVLDLQKGKDFKKEVILDLEYSDSKAITSKVILNLYKQVDILDSKNSEDISLSLNTEVLQKNHLSFIDIDTLFFEIQQFKQEKKWNNLNISKSVIIELLEKNDWYELFIPKSDITINDFEDVLFFQKIITTLIKKYVKAFFEYKKSEWESNFLEYRELDEEKDKASLLQEYTVTIEKKDENEELIDLLKNLEESLKNNKFTPENRVDLKIFNFDKHLYNPLIYTNKGFTALKITPVALNEGEKEFVEDLNAYLERNKIKYENTEIFLLRNQSKTGLGFFAEGNFYPDFIMWIKKENKECITFIDPKGIRNLDSNNDPKINLSLQIKEIEKKLNNPNIILSSFIISNTKYSEIKNSTITKEELESKNVLFQKEDKNIYISNMFENII